MHGWIYSIQNGILKRLCGQEPDARELEIDPDALIAQMAAGRGERTD